VTGMLWLTLLAPLLGAILLLLRPDTRIARAALAVGAAGAAAGLLRWTAWSTTLTFLPRNGHPLVELGLRSDALSAGILLSLLLSAMLQPLTPRLLLTLALTAGALLAPDLAQAVMLGGATVLLTAERSRRDGLLAVSAGVLLLAGLISHTGGLSWSAPLLPDTPQAMVMVGILAFVALGLGGIAPWADRAGLVPPILGLGLLVHSRAMLITAPGIQAALAWLGALGILTAALGQRGLRGGLIGLILLTLGVGATSHAGLLLIAAPPLLAMLSREGDDRLAAALVILGAPPAIGLAGWLAVGEGLSGRPALLAVTATGLLLLAATAGLSRPRSLPGLALRLAPFLALGLLGDALAGLWGGRYAVPLSAALPVVLLLVGLGLWFSPRPPITLPDADALRARLWDLLIVPLIRAADAIEGAPSSARGRWILAGVAVLAAAWMLGQEAGERPVLAIAAYSGTPWLLIAALIPAVGGLLGRFLRPALLLGLLGPGLVTLRLLLGYDLRLGGHQFSTPGVPIGVDSIGIIALAAVSPVALVAAWRGRDLPERLPALLLATAGLTFAIVSLDPMLSFAGLLLAALGLSATERADAAQPLALALVLAAAAGLSVDPAWQVRLMPAAFLGLGALAGLPPLHGGAADAIRRAWKPAAMLRVGLLAPVAILTLTRVVLLMPEGAAVWAQATATLAAAGAVYGALLALGAADRRSLAAGALMTQTGLAGVGLTAFKLDAWSGVLLLALSAGLALVLWLDAEDHDGVPSRGGLLLAGMSLSGAPGTPGFAAILLVAMGCWQSAWWAGAWWVGTGLVALFLLSVAVRDHLPDGALRLPRRLWPVALLIVALGLWPRLLLDPIDRTGAEQLRELVPALRKLMEGDLESLLPESLRGWWL
jgi:hypothetical protein